VEDLRQVRRARRKRRRGEEAGRVVERGVDLLAGGQAILRCAQQSRGALECKQVLADASRQGNVGSHVLEPFWVELPYWQLGDDLLGSPGTDRMAEVMQA